VRRLWIVSHENVDVNCADVKDFVPAPLEGDTYEGFETLVERASAWLEDLSGVVHVSLQSVLVQKGDRKYVSLFPTKLLVFQPFMQFAFEIF